MRDRPVAGVSHEAARMGDRDGVVATGAEDQEVVGARNGAARRVLDERAVREVFLHGAVADGERFFPYVVAGDVGESVLGVEADDVAGEVAERVAAAVPGWDVHAVDGGHPTGHRDASDLLDDVAVMLEELLVA